MRRRVGWHLRGRVMATFRRRSSVTKPRRPSWLFLTQLKTMMSASRPWYPSTDDTTVCNQGSCLSACEHQGEMYGLRTVHSCAEGPRLLLGSSQEGSPFLDRNPRIRMTVSSCSTVAMLP